MKIVPQVYTARVSVDNISDVDDKVQILEKGGCRIFSLPSWPKIPFIQPNPTTFQDGSVHFVAESNHLHWRDFHS